MDGPVRNLPYNKLGYYLLRAIKILITYLHIFFTTVDESEFKTKLTNNAENLLSCHRSFCSNPQPRYTINRLGDSAKPENKYILHHQCLPGCSRTTRATMISDDKFEEISGTRRKSDVVNHLECSPHTPSGRGKSGALRNVPTLSHDSIEEAPDKTSTYIFYYKVQFLILPSTCIYGVG